MKNSQLQRLLNLIQRTGDRLIVADSESGEAFSVMNLSDYEKLIGEDDWQPPLPFRGDASKFAADESDEFDFASDFQPNNGVADKTNDDWLQRDPFGAGNNRPSRMTPLSDVLKDMDYFKESSDLSHDLSPIISEEPLNDVPEAEEEKFYLEPVE